MHLVHNSDKGYSLLLDSPMPRQARLDAPGALHHIMVRGIDKTVIFTELCDEKNYLLALVRYIHLNPVRAQIVEGIEELDRYRWSGHSAIIGNSRHLWMDADAVLSQFGVTKRRAISEYRRFVMEELGCPGAEIARHLEVNTTSINRAIERAEGRSS